VETITQVPDDGRLCIEVRGELAAILRMAKGAEHARSTGGDADALAVQIKLVAGAGKRGGYNFWPGRPPAAFGEVENGHQLAA